MKEREAIETIEINVRRWLENAVIGLNLCPFARPVYTREQVHLAVEEAAGFDPAVMAALVQVDSLLDQNPDDVSTTLIVYPDALGDFDEFLDAVTVLQTLLSEAGADGILQLAHFHPDYQFEGTEPDDVENYTNRAPYPIIQLLREAEVAEAVARHPDPESIPATNIARMKELGAQAIGKMWKKWQ